jgi:hypothetical protein
MSDAQARVSIFRNTQGSTPVKFVMPAWLKRLAGGSAGTVLSPAARVHMRMMIDADRR